MDNHPIPQDVTNFQFRLIGDMTLKQFGYVAAGVVMAWVMLAAPLFLIFKLPIAGMCVLVGVILAFIPIDGRPADIMLLHFIKALFSPTQFVYQKGDTSLTQQPTTMTTMTPQSPPTAIQKEEKKEEIVQLESTESVATAAAQTHHEELPPPEITPPVPTTTMAPAVQEVVLQKEEDALAKALEQAKAQEEQEKKSSIASAATHEKVLDLEKELQDTLQQKQQLEKQLIALQKSLEEKKQPIFAPAVATAPAEQTQHVKQIPKQMTTGAGAPLVPETPNLVTGVIKDSRGNILQNILIEVKDKDNNPVRAFKTNALGQFAAATPLLNGTYTISFEDPAGKHSFDSVEITAQGEIVLPLEIISVDAREKLRQELFGSV